MKHVFILPLAAALVLSGGCATSGPSRMSAKDCASADWRALGVSDGLAGEPLARRDVRAATCAAESAPTDLAS